MYDFSKLDNSANMCDENITWEGIEAVCKD